MAYINDKELLKAKDGFAPQFYNERADEFDVVTGDNGKMYVEDESVVNALERTTGLVVIDSYTGDGKVTKYYVDGGRAVTLVNDGEEDAAISVGGLEIVVKPYEVYDGAFERFTELTTSGDAYRVIVKGVAR